MGSTFVVELSGAPVDEPSSFLILGVLPLNGGVGVDLLPIGMPGCLLVPDILLTVPMPTDTTGVGTVGLPIANSQSGVGITFYAQAFVVDAGANAFGAILSDAVAFTIGCP